MHSNHESQQESSVSGDLEDTNMCVSDNNNLHSSPMTHNLSNPINNASSSNDALYENYQSNENGECIIDINHESLQESYF